MMTQGKKYVVEELKITAIFLLLTVVSADKNAMQLKLYQCKNIMFHAKKVITTQQ